MKSRAEEISARLGNDGQRWSAEDGTTLDQMAEEKMDRKYELDGVDLFRFTDGSWIVIYGGGWDLLDANGSDSVGFRWVSDDLPNMHRED